MTGNDFVDLLLVELKCKDDSSLSRRLNVKAPNVNYWRQQKKLTKAIVRNVLRKLTNVVIKSSFEPIVEFHALDLWHEQNVDSLTKRIASKSLVARLKKEKGIYLFYNSSGKVIYCGRTIKNVLLTEMTQAYGIRRPQYVRKFANANGIFRNQKLSIKDTALYFSAYRVDDVLIANLEAFVTRIVPNDLVNKKKLNGLANSSEVPHAVACPPSPSIHPEGKRVLDGHSATYGPIPIVGLLTGQSTRCFVPARTRPG